jgi:UPF0271 protein
MGIDLNCDLGEWIDADAARRDAEVLAHITSANIACGGHIGDMHSMRETVRLAKSHGVAVGAHPSFADTRHFGRRELALPIRDIEVLIEKQVGALVDVARSEDVHVSHVKPHGALYNMAARDRAVADAVARAVVATDANLALFGLSGSRLLDAGRDVGLTVVAEVFADRAYEADGTLRSRQLPNSVLSDPAFVVERAIQMVTKGTVVASTGEVLCIKSDTICVHSDTPGSVDLAGRLRCDLEIAGVTVRPPNPLGA